MSSEPRLDSEKEEDQKKIELQKKNDSQLFDESGEVSATENSGNVSSVEREAEPKPESQQEELETEKPVIKGIDLFLLLQRRNNDDPTRHSFD